MPSRTVEPTTSSTVTVMASPRRIRSPGLRVMTSMGSLGLLFGRRGDRVEPEERRLLARGDERALLRVEAGEPFGEGDDRVVADLDLAESCAVDVHVRLASFRPC